MSFKYTESGSSLLQIHDKEKHHKNILQNVWK